MKGGVCGSCGCVKLMSAIVLSDYMHIAAAKHDSPKPISNALVPIMHPQKP